MKNPMRRLCVALGTARATGGEGDPHDLQRFLLAQEDSYARALAELSAGLKRSHWMWFIFPQLDGLGHSATARHYAIKNLEEARAYVAHPVLGPRLLHCAEALLGREGCNARDILGHPDDLKLRSCATLFAIAAPEQPLFQRLLDRFYQGARDTRTLDLLALD
jgi:uncharacterized protein (DUF1810 family)